MKMIGLIGAIITIIIGLGAGVGIGIATDGTAQAIVKKPKILGKIQGILLLEITLLEATAIYGLVIAIMLMGSI